MFKGHCILVANVTVWMSEVNFCNFITRSLCVVWVWIQVCAWKNYKARAYVTTLHSFVSCFLTISHTIHLFCVFVLSFYAFSSQFCYFYFSMCSNYFFLLLFSPKVGNALSLLPDCAFSLVWNYNHRDRCVYISLRAATDAVDVSAIASQFGGGEHSICPHTPVLFTPAHN